MQELRIGIVGLGNMGAAHVQSVKSISRARLSAVCDLKKELSDNMAEKHGANLSATQMRCSVPARSTR